MKLQEDIHHIRKQQASHQNPIMSYLLKEKIELLKILDSYIPSHIIITPFEIFWKKHESKRTEIATKYMTIWTVNIKKILETHMKDVTERFPESTEERDKCLNYYKKLVEQIDRILEIL